MIRSRFLPPAAALLLVSALGAQQSAPAAGEAAPPTEPVDFQRQIRPILSDNCFSCHGPDAEAREAGLRLDLAEGARADLGGYAALVPGDLDASELWYRVSTDFDADRMPPDDSGKELSAEEVALLRAWIEQGGEYEQHWSFVPPERPVVPQPLERAPVRNPIDAFWLERLEAHGLQPAPEADRATLIRRVTLDLTGLPPTPAEVDAFLADEAPDAYGRVVDRLLASPAHAEHMARHWLDLARYGDTHGLHLDNYRSMHRYRDWVVEAFREGKPYDDFVVEQLAGDLLPEPEVEHLIASGFNRCNPTSAEGGMIAEEFLAKYAMDRTDTFGTVFLGLSVGCAQCHDHRYDPVSQEEYYRLFAFFNNLDEEASDRNAPAPRPAIRAPYPEQEVSLAALDARVEGLAARLDAPMPEVDAAQRVWEDEARARLAASWQRVAADAVTTRDGSGARQLEDGFVVLDGDNPAREVVDVAFRAPADGLTALRLELAPEAGTQTGGVGRSTNGNIVLSEVELWHGAPEQGQRLALRAALSDHDQQNYPVAATLDGDVETGWALLPQTDRAHTALFLLDPQSTHPANAPLTLRLRYESVHQAHVAARFRLSATDAQAYGPIERGDWWQSRFLPAASGGEAFRTAYGFEESIDLYEYADSTTPVWERHPEYVDGALHQLEGDTGAVYLVRELWSPTARTVRAHVGSDDALRVWLNGEELLAADVQRALAADQNSVELPLRAGRNEVLLKVVNYAGGFGFTFRLQDDEPGGLPVAVQHALGIGAAQDAAAAQLRDFFRRRQSPEWRVAQQEHAAAVAERDALLEEVPMTLISRERDEVRPAHLLVRGQYDQPAQQVERGVPAFLPPLPEDDAPDRLTLAQWLFRDDHPLTARVQVNRLWQMMFGAGLVRTSEDFGSQGELPSHPELLDWLAVELRAGEWDQRRLLRLIATSSVYRQDARWDPAKAARDPDNRYLARGARFRLDAEVIRDQALAASGLLVREVGGPSVKPYQPIGLWKAVGYTRSNTANFVRDDGDKLWRRSLYTFWKRTSPPPTMALFDAPTRELCTARRERTNTPLQALALWNDTQFVEAARGLGERMMRRAEADGDSRAGLRHGFRLVLARSPSSDELDLLEMLLRRQRAAYADRAEAAQALLDVGERAVPGELDVTALAAWTLVGNALLNLDETVMRR